VSKSGRCGYYMRIGQTEETTACGAAIGAYNKVKDLRSPPVSPDPNGFDTQMQHINQVIWHNRQRIEASDAPIAEATYVLYEHIRDYIFEIVNTKDLNGGKIIILGGIYINNDPYDYFEPKMCICLDKYGRKDILNELFA